MVKDVAEAVGYVRLQKRGADGALVYDQVHKNQLTNYARSASAQMWAGVALSTPSKIQVGVGAPTAPKTGVDPNDADLWLAMDGTLKACDFITTWLMYSTQYSVTYGQSEAVGSWTEVGLKDAQGNLWSHVAVDGFVKNVGETVTVQWQVQHVGN